MKEIKRNIVLDQEKEEKLSQAIVDTRMFIYFVGGLAAGAVNDKIDHNYLLRLTKKLDQSFNEVSGLIGW